jgi:excisionase family DNA binding protein
MKSLGFTAEILTRTEGAAFLKMSQPTFDKLYRFGGLKCIKAGRLIRFRRADILALARSADGDEA